MSPSIGLFYAGVSTRPLSAIACSLQISYDLIQIGEAAFERHMSRQNQRPTIGRDWTAKVNYDLAGLAYAGSGRFVRDCFFRAQPEFAGFEDFGHGRSVASQRPTARAVPDTRQVGRESHPFFVTLSGLQRTPNRALSGQLPSAKQSDGRPRFPARCGHVPKFRAASGQYVVCMTMKVASPKIVSAVVAQTVPETVCKQ